MSGSPLFYFVHALCDFDVVNGATTPPKSSLAQRLKAREVRAPSLHNKYRVDSKYAICRKLSMRR